MNVRITIPAPLSETVVDLLVYNIDGSDKSYCEGPQQQPNTTNGTASLYGNSTSNITPPNNSTSHDTSAHSNSTKEPHCLLDEPFDGKLSISWTWQYCTQWGFFQPTNLGPMQLGSKWSSLQHQQVKTVSFISKARL